MAGILAKFTSTPVRVATHRERLAPDTIYVVPSGACATIRDGRFELETSATETRGKARRAIDSLLSSLAEQLGGRSVGVVLSGMGRDGAEGLAAMAASGGVTMVQDPASAAFDSMPRGALALGAIAFVGTPDAIADRLVAVLTTPPSAGAEDLSHVLAALARRTGHDFRSYKASTVRRRIERRMTETRTKTLADYRALVDGDPLEPTRLLDELLISVTSFFRDPAVFDVLARTALPDLVDRAPPGKPIRGWVAGCATGEEAYSLAMTLREVFDARGILNPPPVQIYASDLDEAAIARAREGYYPASIADQVTPARLERYFVADPRGYRIKSAIREQIVFATHNILSDPPFTRMDIVSCRNVLIYLSPLLQRRVLALFHHSLTPRGVLVLGTAESVSELADGFTPIDDARKIFQRSACAPLLGTYAPASTTRRSPNAESSAHKTSLPAVVEHAIVEAVAPPVAVVTPKGDLVFASQRLGTFFELPRGATSVNVVAMAREGLEVPLRGALQRAKKSRAPVALEGIDFKKGADWSRVDVRIVPIADPSAGDLYLVALEETKGAAKGSSRAAARRSSERADVMQLRQQLRKTVAEMERSEAELNDANSELQSANEELQSANEELMTSKEEMESLNEELLAVNSELQVKNEALGTANDDLRNLLNASQIPTLFLDGRLRLKRFTTHATRVANVLPSDIGRPITDLTLKVEYPELESDVHEVLETLVFKEVQVEGGGSTFSTRVHPYRTMDDVVDGVVITFLDVTALGRTSRDDHARTIDDVVKLVVAKWPGIAWIEDARTSRAVATSDESASVLGCAPSALLDAGPEVWRALRHRDDRAIVDGAFRVRLADGTFGRFVDRRTAIASDGSSPRLVLHALTRVLDGGG
jgi:two-component system, chemotaxis family, CheB/CheR fusion protein